MISPLIVSKDSIASDLLDARRSVTLEMYGRVHANRRVTQESVGGDFQTRLERNALALDSKRRRLSCLFSLPGYFRDEVVRWLLMGTV
jgi:hypothetical protein